MSKTPNDPFTEYLGLQGSCLTPYLTDLLTHRDHITRRKHWRTHLEIDWLQYVLQWMPCAMHDYKYELVERALWWWRWLWRWKWRRLGFVDDDDDEEVLAMLDACLLVFRRGPLYKSCSGGRPASVSTPNDRSCERVRSHGTPSLTLVAFWSLLVTHFFSIFLPFLSPTWFLPFLAHFLWKHIKERICGILCIH